MRRADLLLLLLAVLAGILFFASLTHIWPLAAIDVNQRPDRLIPVARAFLAEHGIDVSGYSAASALRLDEFSLDYVTRKSGLDGAQELIRGGRPLYFYEVDFKKHGDPDWFWADVHPRAGVIGWGRTMQEDAAGAFLDADAARTLATAAVLDPRLPHRTRTTSATPQPGNPATGRAVEKGHTQRDRPSRRDHVFVFESYLSRTPELRERVTVTVSGANVTAVQRQLVPPESARREARKREAPVAALQMTSFLFLGAAGIAAIVIFLLSLQRGEVLLKRAAGWVAIVAVIYIVSQALRTFALLRDWDPLWPRAVATLQTLGFSLAQGAWIAFLLLVVLAAGDAVDRRSGANRGESFWRAGRGRVLDADVGAASARGFLVGLICGGAMVATLLLLEKIAGAFVGLQPQGFFFFAINSRLPAISTLLYFFLVAMTEESAYRFFAGSWLLSLTKRKWIAIVVPGVLYGASHTGLAFLPPVEPFWGRALALSVVGCVWGWAFFRFDALTVILSHFTADLFIFNWPRLGSGDPLLMAKAIATMCVPLIPAMLLLVARLARRRVGS